METLFTLIGVGIIGIWAIKIMFAIEKSNNHAKLIKEIPIYWTDKLDQEFTVLGSVSSSKSHKIDAEIDLIYQAKKLGSDAIICVPIGISTHSSGNLSTSRGFFDGSTKINDSRQINNVYHYNGTAIKFKVINKKKEIVENYDVSSINIQEYDFSLLKNDLTNLIEFKNNLLKEILLSENEIILEIDKQKKLLDNGVIDNIEFNNRIDSIKKQISDKKNSLKEIDEKILILNEAYEKIKKVEDEANVKLERQNKLLNMNIIDRKEYEKEISLIKDELSIKRSQIKLDNIHVK